MISCSKCKKENQDHYKFCLGCGSELPREVAPKPFAAPRTPPQGVPAVAAPAAYAPPVVQAPAPVVQAPAPVMQAPAPAVQAPAAPAAGAPCPQCGESNAPNNMFCLTCGFRLAQAMPSAAPPAPVAMPVPTAPAPMVAPVAVSDPFAAPAPAPQAPIFGTAPAAAPIAAPAPVAPMFAPAHLTALRADGSEAGTYTLPQQPEVTVGRDSGSIFAGDSYLSPRHATFTQRAPSGLSVRDAGSLNGVYKKLTRDMPVELRHGDVFRIGQEIVRYEAIEPLPPSPDGVERLGAPSRGYVGRIALVIGRETTGNAFPVPDTGLHIGRERGDVLFPEDGYVSGLHCRLSFDAGRTFLTDLGSSNGTFLRIGHETEVLSGDILLMGQQLFRAALG